MADSEKIFKELKEKLFPKGCKRILFVVPPESPEAQFDIDLVLRKRYPCFPPYGSGMLSRQLKDRGYETNIIDLNFLMLQAVHKDSANFNYQIWQQQLTQEINRFRPDFIGLSVMFSFAHDSMIKVCKYIKKRHSGIPIIVGGIYVSNDIERILRECQEIDFGMSFEADVSFPDLIDAINEKLPVDKIAQLSVLRNGECITWKNRTVPDINSLNVQPDYLDLPIGEYSRYGALGNYNFLLDDKKATSVQGNRGCHARCSFCSAKEYHGGGVRSRNVTAVVDEIQFLYETYGISHFTWLDDDLLFNEKRVITLFTEIIKRNIKITWDASNGLIASAITPEIMTLAYESGCIGVHLGIESGNEQILRSIRKPSGRRHFYRAKEQLDRYPQIFVKGYLIIGFPNETLGQIMDTVKMACELEFHWYPLQFLSLLPRTDITMNAVKQGLIGKDDVSSQYHGETAGSKSASGGSLRQREIEEKLEAKEFKNIFEEKSMDYVPTLEELRDIWFVADYKINYEKLLHVNDPIKLSNIRKMLMEIADKYTFENSLGNLFMAVLEQKLGQKEEGMRRLLLAEQYLSESKYWQKRYEVLGIYNVVDAVKRGCFLAKYDKSCIR